MTNLTLSDAQRERLARLRDLTPDERSHVDMLLAVAAPTQVDWALRAVEDERAGRQP
jgi:hypothetical protein